MSQKINLETQVQGVLSVENGGTGSSSSLSGSANLVYATPNGSTGLASLRALVVADLPNPIDMGTF